MSTLLATFGQNIVNTRKALGISQEKLALNCNIDRSYLGRVERGELNITLEKIYQIANALGCHPRDLLP
jgi:transcriptional regulator with XRE-family HTH domain